MTRKDNRPEQAVELRRQAEEIARGKAAQSPKNLDPLSPKETRPMLQELQVHQIELEVQNEELRRAQAELDASRTRYFDLYDLAPVGYCTLSGKGLILEANLTAANLLGMSRGALVKQHLTRFIRREDRVIYYKLCKQLFETDSASSGQAGKPQACELRMTKKDGTACWTHLEAIAALDADGAPVCRVVLGDITDRKRALEALQRVHDELEQLVADRTEGLMRVNEELRKEIAERKQAEAALHDAEIRYRLLFEHSPDGIVIIDPATTRPLEFNDTAHRQLGYSRDEFARLSISDIDASETPDETRSHIQQVIREGRSDFETLHRTRQDEIRNIHVTAQYTEIAGHHVYHCIWRDITERKREEEALKASKDFMEAVLDNIKESLIVIDPANYTILEANTLLSQG